MKQLSSIFILTRSLNVGGAERQVVVLAKALHQRGYDVTVGVFYSGGVLEEELRKAGVAICPLGKKGRWDLIGWFCRYLKTIRTINPDVIYSFLTTSNIVALFGKVFVPKPVVWGIRASNMHLQNYDGLARFSAWVEKKLSRFPQAIVFNSHVSCQYHASSGYPLNKATVISNGIDTDIFRPDFGSRVKIRRQLKIPEDAVLVGMLARVDPMKDYETYLKASCALASRHPGLVFLAAGAGTDTLPYPPPASRFLGLGVWKDVPHLLNALDILVLSSAFGEGFPNVVGEAMACGIPAVVTDVGDAAYVVDGLGVVVPPGNPEALAQGIETLMKCPPSKEDIRNRIITNFSVSRMVDQTVHVLTKAGLAS